MQRIHLLLLYCFLLLISCSTKYSRYVSRYSLEKNQQASPITVTCITGQRIPTNRTLPIAFPGRWHPEC